MVAIVRNLITQQIIQIRIQPTLSHHPRTLRLQGAAGSISRIGKQRFLPFCPFLIQFFKRSPWHQNLTTNLKLMRIATTLLQFQRNRTNRAHVVRHIITLHAITSRHRLHKLTIHIGQRNAQPVILHLRTNLEILSFQSLLHAVVEIAHLTLIICVCQRQHRVLVRHRLERLVQITSHPLCR